jgi:hypothetical protein
MVGAVLVLYILTSIRPEVSFPGLGTYRVSSSFWDPNFQGYFRRLNLERLNILAQKLWNKRGILSSVNVCWV